MTNLQTDTVTEGASTDNVEHYVCCDLSESFYGFTMTYCGKQVLELGTIEEGDDVTCAPCAEIVKHPKTMQCPLGYKCE